MNYVIPLAIVRTSAVVTLLGGMAFTGLALPDGTARHGTPIVPKDGVLQAVGKLNYRETGLRRDCTSFLLGPRHVVTARHCVDSQPMTGSAVRVHLGYNDASQRSAVKVPTEVDVPLTGRDVAHLCLPRSATTAPLSAAARPVKRDERVVVVHYAAPRLHLQQRQECKVVAHLRNNELVIDCRLDTGASGAPVIGTSREGSPEVLGVVVKAGKGFAVAVPLVERDLDMCGGADEVTAFAAR